jgi:ribonuclease E
LAYLPVAGREGAGFVSDEDQTTTDQPTDQINPSETTPSADDPTTAAPAKRRTRARTAGTTSKTTRRKAATEAPPADDAPAPNDTVQSNDAAQTGGGDAPPVGDEVAAVAPVDAAAKPRTRRRSSSSSAPAPAGDGSTAPAEEPAAAAGAESVAAEAPTRAPRRRKAAAPPTITFIAPPEEPAEAEPADAPAKRGARRSKAQSSKAESSKTRAVEEPEAEDESVASASAEVTPAAEPDRPADAEESTSDAEASGGESEGSSRRRRRGRRGRGRGGADSDHADEVGDGGAEDPDADADAEPAEASLDEHSDAASDDGSSSTRRRRRRRRRGGDGDAHSDNDADDEVQSVKGSTRLEAKRQRRRDGREQTRRRPAILSESEFLARREAVRRTMAVRQRGDRTQIAVLEDDVLVEHYVTKASSTSYAGNVYLGRVQNVLPSMEAAFIDIGKGRNAVLYAGEVNWDQAGLGGKARSIEQALKSGDSVLVQVTKDPIGHKGARLTSQISLPGRYLVYVPGGSMTGISRKLPENERNRLKAILSKIVPDDAGVIIRTAAEGATEEALSRDVARLKAQWEVISSRAEKEKSSAPTVLHEEPDLAIRVVRDIFNEDIGELVVSGADVAETLESYIEHVAPDLRPRLRRHTGESDLFAELRVDEQLAKALDRKVWLPSGGTLVIDRTEAMTVIDVNTGRFVGDKGGNLEETVTRNNLEAAEEIVRQLRLRDVGGIIVIDFVDMVLESNRELVLRRLTECLGRDRTRHQVAEVTSLGLVQMTRKRVGQGLLEAFSEPCEHCKGRGVIVHSEPVDLPSNEHAPSSRRESGSRRDSRGSNAGRGVGLALAPGVIPTPAQLAPVLRAVPTPPVPAPTAPAAAASADADEPHLADPPAASPSEASEPTAPNEAVPESAPALTPGGRRRGRRRAAVREAGPPVASEA